MNVQYSRDHKLPEPRSLQLQKLNSSKTSCGIREFISACKRQNTVKSYQLPELLLWTTEDQSKYFSDHDLQIWNSTILQVNTNTLEDMLPTYTGLKHLVHIWQWTLKCRLSPSTMKMETAWFFTKWRLTYYIYSGLLYLLCGADNMKLNAQNEKWASAFKIKQYKCTVC
jgi:hypothetical protein